MITEEYLKDNFLTAYFIDNERKNIEIQTTSEDKKSVFSTVIPYEENNTQYQALTKFMNIDQLHESTYQRNTEQRKLYEQEVLRIAQKEGLVLDQNRLDTKFYPKIIQALLEEVDNIDQIFALKLALFEHKAISDSKNDDAKKKLRQAKDKLEALKVAIDIVSK